MELQSTTRSPEVVINHEFIMYIVWLSLDISLDAASTEKMDSRAVKMKKKTTRGKMKVLLK